MEKGKVTMSRRTRVIIAATILICFFASFVGIVASYILRFDKELTIVNQTHLAEVASYVSSHMTSVVNDTQESLKAVASAVALMESRDMQMAYLERVAEQYSFAYIGCAGPDGMLYATVPSESMDVSSEDYFKNALRGECTVSNLTRKIFYDRAASGILLTVPIGKDAPNGVLVAMMEVSQLSSALSLKSFGGDGYSYIFDKNGTIIMRTKSLDFNNLFKAWQTVEFDKGYSFQQFYDDAMNNRQGIVRYNNLGVKQYAYYQPIPFNNWFIVNIVSEQAVSAKVNELTRELFLIGIAITVVFLGLLYLALRSYGASQDSKQADNAKSSFLANMSHEIRTPMNAIVGISEILLRDDLTQGQRNKVLNILNSGKSLLTIINDILDLSKIEAGKFTIIDESYELESLLYDLTVIAAIRIGEKPLEFLVEMDSALPRNFIGDMGRVKQVLLNIIGNAIKFTDSGYIRLIVEGKQENGVWMLRIEVKDTGIGIKAEDLDKLFASFSQVDTHRNHNIEGTGLGLTISRRLCEMMGGTISVTSEYGKGSSFVITIQQGIIDEAMPVRLPDEALSLLLCEQSEILRDYETSSLDKFNLRYDMCSTCEEFVQKAADGHYTHALARSDVLNLLDNDTSICLVALFGLSEHSLIDSSTINIYVPIFQLQLPYALQGIADASYAPKHAGINLDSIKEMPYVSILIVDDNQVNIQVAKGLMEPYNMWMDEACSGEEAVKAVQNKSYDLVLMDHMMPGMNGIEATQYIRALPDEKYKTLPIVALTANATSEARLQFLNEGFDDFLAKPIETQKLNSILRKYLKQLNADRAAAGNSAPPPLEQAEMVISSIPDSQSTEVNFSDGQASIGSPAVYMKILQVYLDSTKAKVVDLPNWLEADKERFVIEIHGLKSASAAIGAARISMLAAEMEQQGKDGDFEFIASELAFFLERSAVALQEIEAFLTPEEDVPAEVVFDNEDTRKHIAIVDDNPVNLDLAENALSQD